jgi:nitrate reductase / nitrite oxidoreductase, alpha subunit
VRNGVVTRIGPSMKYGEATDLLGNRTTSRWDPRVCQKGLALTRRFYGDRRVNGCMVRPASRSGTRTASRARSRRPAAEEVLQAGPRRVAPHHPRRGATIAAAVLKNIAETYSRRRGQAPAEGAALRRGDHRGHARRGARRTMKFRGGMPLLGITRVFGMYRLANSMALLDANVRKVGPDEALGGKGFDNYSWHTDLPPGHPMVTGQQTVEFDLTPSSTARRGGVGHELDHHQDARRPLADRSPAQGHARSW